MKPITLGAFKPVGPGTSLARILEAAMPGDATVEQIAAQAALRPDQVTHRLRHGLGAAHGIGYTKGEDGVVRLVLPAGKAAGDLIAKVREADPVPAKPDPFASYDYGWEPSPAKRAGMPPKAAPKRRKVAA
jgi:hypothetical protein